MLLHEATKPGQIGGHTWDAHYSAFACRGKKSIYNIMAAVLFGIRWQNTSTDCSKCLQLCRPFEKLNALATTCFQNIFVIKIPRLWKCNWSFKRLAKQ